MNKNIFITGATGNVGFEVIRFMHRMESPHTIIAGVRDLERAKEKFKFFPELQFANFDFENPETFNRAFKNIHTLFLIRPPHISNVEKYFRPLVSEAKKKGVEEVLFISVQDAEKSKIIPHHKIEKLIGEFGFDSIFLRPSYFMQNITTTLLKDIREKKQIVLPAGDAKFNWIDVRNIGEASAVLLQNFEDYKNQAIEITGYENQSFHSVVETLNEILSVQIQYRDVNPLSFYILKQKEGNQPGKILVMIMLHFLRRFKKEPAVSDFYEKLTGKKPTTIPEFLERNKTKFTNQKADGSK